MKYLDFHTLRKGIYFAIFLICLVVPIAAQTDSISNLPQYLFPKFSKGIVLLKSGTSITASLNYNTVTEKMTFYQKNDLMNLDKPETVDTIFLQNRKFVFIENAFYEVLEDAPVTFFIQNRSELTSTGKPSAYGAPSQTASSTSISKLYSDKTYNLKLPEDIKVTPSTVYWVRTGNVMNKFVSERQFLKIFPAKENELKKFISNSNINFKKHEDLIKLAVYCNELIR